MQVDVLNDGCDYVALSLKSGGLGGGCTCAEGLAMQNY